MSQTKAGSMIAMSASNRIGKPAGTLGTPEAARITDTTGHLPRPHRCNFESRATCSIWPKHFDGMGAFLAMPKGVAATSYPKPSPSLLAPGARLDIRERGSRGEGRGEAGFLWVYLLQ